MPPTLRDVPPPARDAYGTNRVTHTKYTVLTFLPLNLWDQFQRPVNLYFLIIAALQFVPIVAPVSPLTTLLPLALAFGLSAARELADDLRRYAADRRANQRPVKTTEREGDGGGGRVRVKRVRAEHLRVGDVVVLEAGEEAPCDVVALVGMDPEGTCEVSTESIDGEVDAKERVCVLGGVPSGCRQGGIAAGEEPADAMLRHIEPHWPLKMKSEVPNAAIRRFHGLWERSDGTTMALDASHLILQTSRLHAPILGLAVFTGNQTKLGMTKRHPPTKWARLDRMLSKFIVVSFLAQVIMVVTFAAIGGVHVSREWPTQWYLGGGIVHVTLVYYVVILPVRFFLLLSVLIPISFKVNVDLSKYFISRCIEWDLEMYDSFTDTPAVVNNTALAEDLGQVSYIFSDKTGTLTCNQMILRHIAVSGKIYGSTGTSLAACGKASATNADICAALQILCMCNSVVGDGPDYSKWSSSSPDEVALLDGAAVCGWRLTKKTRAMILLVTPTGQVTYHIHRIVPFSSERGRMSVLVQEEGARTMLLLAKGADERILPRCVDGEIDSALENVAVFAASGLRTLVLAIRFVSVATGQAWISSLQQASTMNEEKDRVSVAQQVYDDMESGLTCVGTTALEDRLQDGVPSAIQSLREAGIRVWMLTGDKGETAKQIGLSSGILSPTAQVVDIAAASDDGTIERLNELFDEYVVESETPNSYDAARRKSLSRPFSVMISGGMLELIQADSGVSEKLLAILMKAQSAVCYRMTPDQKAFVVRAVRDAGPLTLAIGDGSNDVAMIQDAQVGVGISGREGQQAARAADYSISQFRFLVRLLLVHGHNAYQRTAYIVQYCFYKSTALGFAQWLFNIFAGFSGVTFWNSYALTLYNGVYTLSLVLFYAMDNHLSPEILLSRPSCYKFSQTAIYMNPWTFTSFVFRGILHSTIIVLLTLSIFSGDATTSTGQPFAGETLFVPAFTALMVLQVFVVVVESHSVTLLHWMSCVMCLTSYVVTFVGYNALPAFAFYRQFAFCLHAPLFALGTAATAAAVMGLHGVVAAVAFWRFPNGLQRQRQTLGGGLGESLACRPLCRDEEL